MPLVWHNGHPNDWNLTCHISGMAIRYNEAHREWALNIAPDFDLKSSPGAEGRKLRPFVVAEVAPHLFADFSELTRSPVFSDSELLWNLTEGYELVAALEIRLHRFVVQKLKAEYGDEEWWTKGVPQNIRKACSERSEEDDNRYDRWSYLDLLHLHGIMKNKWPQICQGQVEGLKNFPGKGQFLKQFEIMNDLRNQIMHPLKGKPLGNDDFEFLRNLSGTLDRFAGES